MAGRGSRVADREEGERVTKQKTCSSPPHLHASRALHYRSPCTELQPDVQSQVVEGGYDEIGDAPRFTQNRENQPLVISTTPGQ